jgi:hypothetical protein
MPGRPHVSIGYEHHTTGLTPVLHVTPLPREQAFVVATVKRSSRGVQLVSRPSVCIQFQQTRQVTKRGRPTAAVDHPARCGTTRNPLTCTDATSCPRCPVYGSLERHVAPVTGRVTDGQEYGDVPFVRFGKGLGSPFAPVDRVCGVLESR